MTTALPNFFLRACCVPGVVLGLGLLGPAARAQVGIGTTTPDASALLELSTTNKGLLLPRLTQAQRDAIQSPAAGLMVYQTDQTAGLYIYGGTSWSLLPAATQVADHLGNHTATQALNLAGHALTGTGSSISGVGVRADGGLNLGENTAGNNIFLGYLAGNGATGSRNLHAGYWAGQLANSGSDNVLLG
ncbi:hypothetical protein GCM10027048_06910 [Hymenobacter coalescens]